ncbi:response regulator transcription factor [Chitinophaga parva]|nr:LuxR C-terminal-related transcriptional regulator [Chitinophaga parva]
MQIQRSLSPTYEKHLQDIFYAKDTFDERQIPQLFQKAAVLHTALHHTSPVFFLVDYTRSQYLVMSGGTKIITTYDPREFMEGGIPMLRSIYQRDDFKVYNESIFPANIDFLSSQPQHLHQEFIFTYNFRIRNKAGRDVQLLQRGCYITSAATGLPLFSLGTATDITLFKKDTLIHHTIERQYDVKGRPVQALMAENHFYPQEEDRLLTTQEHRILSYMAEGWSSKQIAAHVNIAENTVSNHRKNMLRKTNTKNMAELIAYAFRHRLL